MSINGGESPQSNLNLPRFSPDIELYKRARKFLQDKKYKTDEISRMIFRMEEIYGETKTKIQLLALDTKATVVTLPKDPNPYFSPEEYPNLTDLDSFLLREHYAQRLEGFIREDVNNFGFSGFRIRYIHEDGTKSKSALVLYLDNKPVKKIQIHNPPNLNENPFLGLPSEATVEEYAKQYLRSLAEKKFILTPEGLSKFSGQELINLLRTSYGEDNIRAIRPIILKKKGFTDTEVSQYIDFIARYHIDITGGTLETFDLNFDPATLAKIYIQEPSIPPIIMKHFKFFEEDKRFGNKIIPFLAPLKKIPGFVESLESHEDYRVLGMASEFYTSQVQNERIVLTHKSRKSIPVIPINTPFSKENLQTLLKILSQNKY